MGNHSILLGYTNKSPCFKINTYCHRVCLDTRQKVPKKIVLFQFLNRQIHSSDASRKRRTAKTCVYIWQHIFMATCIYGNIYMYIYTHMSTFEQPPFCANKAKTEVSHICLKLCRTRCMPVKPDRKLPAQKVQGMVSSRT